MSEVETQTDGAPQRPQISLIDLANVIQILDAVTSRGAFRGEELEAVGSTRNRIAEFVKAATPEQPEEGGPADADETEEVVVEEVTTEE
jgi:hypothetical protein